MADGEAVAEIAALWDRFKGAAIERVEVLEAAVLALLEGSLEDDRRQEAIRAAHKLAGSAGTFGFAEASALARELELTLGDETGWDAGRVHRLSEVVVTLRQELERPRGAAHAPTAPAPLDSRRSLLIVVDDQEVADRVAVEAVARGLAVETAPTTERARQAVAASAPAVVLLDLTFTEGEDGGLRFLRDLTHRAPPIPVLVFTGRDSFLDRVAVAEAGGRGFLPKSLPASEVVDAVLRVVEERAGARVLAVDDDPQILGVLRALLEAEGMRLTTLADPLGFWDALESTAPDLLVLDVDMPHLTGLDLCKVVRNEARWRTLPILFLTGHTDAQTVQAIFAAGADDYVAKPIVGPELLTRIRNRLERTQLLRRVAEVDPLTGAANRSKAERELDHYLRLARRQGQPVSIAVLDIDHLSEVNARHGNATGDAVLRRTSELLHGLFRSEDIVARWGEDEFLVGMYGMKRSDAVQRAAEIVELLRAEAFGEASREGGQVTLTGGVAQFPADGADLRVLYCRAEDVMSRAKAAGCDRVVPVGWEPSGGAWAGKERVDVVLVDDDETLGALLLHALDTRGYTAAWLQDGEMAVRRLSGPDSDLAGRVVLLDVDLPGRNGLTVLRCLAADGIVRESRVLMLTARSVEDEVVEALQLGAFDHVTKPFSLPILMQRIRRALEA